MYSFEEVYIHVSGSVTNRAQNSMACLWVSFLKIHVGANYKINNENVLRKFLDTFFEPSLNMAEKMKFKKACAFWTIGDSFFFFFCQKEEILFIIRISYCINDKMHKISV